MVRKILQNLGLRETQQQSPPKKITSSPTVEPISEECMPWAADPVYEYEHLDPVYPD